MARRRAPWYAPSANTACRGRPGCRHQGLGHRRVPPLTSWPQQAHTLREAPSRGPGSKDAAGTKELCQGPVTPILRRRPRLPAASGGRVWRALPAMRCEPLGGGYVVASKRSTAAAPGKLGSAPTTVVASAPAALALCPAETRSPPEQSQAARAPQNASPAAVVSTASTL